MAAFHTAQSFLVSEPLFRLMSEGVRLHSNEIVALSSLPQLIEARRCPFLLSLRRHELATLREHFAAVLSGGPIQVECALSRAGADCLAQAREWLASELGFEASVTDALSALLFDYAVERAAVHMLDRLKARLISNEGRTAPSGDDSANVIPIR